MLYVGSLKSSSSGRLQFARLGRVSGVAGLSSASTVKRQENAAGMTAGGVSQPVLRMSTSRLSQFWRAPSVIEKPSSILSSLNVPCAKTAVLVFSAPEFVLM